jgi:two-component system nitrogen regulation response regulator GlnG
MQFLEAYAWPGNVREFQSVLKQALLRATGPVLIPEALPEEVRDADARVASAPAAPEQTLPPPPTERDLDRLIEGCLRDAEGNVYERVIAAVERVLLVQVMRQNHGNLTRASQVLGLYRATLRTKLRALGFSLDKVLVREDES